MDTTTNEQPRCLTLADTAERLKISYNRVNELVQSGHLRASRVGRQVRITPQDLNDYLDASRIPGPEAKP